MLKAKLLKQFYQFLLIFTLVFNFSFAQEDDGDEEMIESTKGDILIVTSAGLGGAILGLSTLSFVEEPKEHTRNIIVGAALGIMAGVAIVAYTQATKSKEMFYEDEEGEEGAPAEGEGAGETSAKLKIKTPKQFNKIGKSKKFSITQDKSNWFAYKEIQNSLHSMNNDRFSQSTSPVYLQYNFTF